MTAAVMACHPVQLGHDVAGRRRVRRVLKKAVQQILDALIDPPILAYNTVLTTIRILERKGYVQHSKDGRAHVYRTMVERDEASRSEIRHLVGRFFRNSHEDLVLNILEERGIAPEELKRLKGMLEQSDGGAER